MKTQATKGEIIEAFRKACRGAEEEMLRKRLERNDCADHEIRYALNNY